MKAPISVCLIVKNDEACLEQCILSFKDYVSEIVIVDTGSTDQTPEIAKKYADIFEVYTGCNDPDGKIASFADARNKSFSLATQPFVLWVDSDDVISGAEHFHKITDAYEKSQLKTTHDAVAWLFCYEYAYNANNEVILTHYRERLVSNKDKFRWVNPVHEVLIPREGQNVAFINCEEIVWQHRRQFINKPSEAGRNLRILKKYVDEVGTSDARQLYYLGLEYFNVNMLDEAVDVLTKYVELSGWEDEKCMACFKMVDICTMRADYNSGLKWAFKAIENRESWGEGYFALAKMFYHLAEAKGASERRNWEKCVYFAKLGLKCSPTKTLLFINPFEREHIIHLYLNVALNKIGDVEGALESCCEGLKKVPYDEMLITNKKLYENYIQAQNAITAINLLMKNGHLDDQSTELIADLINKRVTASKIKSDKKEDSLIATVLNSYSNDTVNLKSSPIVPTRIIGEGALDIVFFIGDGLEVWTPDTVKKTGIGGSELMAVNLSKRLAALGHRVRVYSGCGDMEGIYDDVEYHNTQRYQNLNCDVLIVSRRADALADCFNVQAKLKLLWIHDVFALNATNELLLKADKILALSEWHKQNIINYHHLHPDHVIVTRNGIDLNRFEGKAATRNRFRAVNSSSPDRSWPVLFEVWPRIKEKVPQAELHLYYGFKNWEVSAQHDPAQMALIGRLKQQIKDLEPLGVVYHDRISQDELAQDLLSTGVWTYCTWFCESSCITAMEMQAAGVRMVTSNIAALKETAGSRAVLIDGEWTSEEYKTKFVDEVVKAMHNCNNQDRFNLQKYAKEHFCLDRLAKDWESMFKSLLSKPNAINPYKPTAYYL